MSLLGIIVVGMITFGAWCMVGIASLIIQVWLFTFHDYAAWLGARRIADGTIEFNENVIVAAVLLWPCNLFWMVGKALSKTPFSLRKILNRIIAIQNKN